MVKVEKFRGFSRFCGFLTKTYRRKDRDDNLLFIYFCFYGVLEARLNPNIYSPKSVFTRELQLIILFWVTRLREKWAQVERLKGFFAFYRVF